MSRSCYDSEYGDKFPGQIDLYRANVDRSMRGYFGQARLRELRDALLALPAKELQADIFAEGSNESPRVCALGAWAFAKTGDINAAREMVGSDADDHETWAALQSHGWPKLVVFDAVFQNDEGNIFGDETPAQRYNRVLAWVESELRPSPAAREAPADGSVSFVNDGENTAKPILETEE